MGTSNADPDRYANSLKGCARPSDPGTVGARGNDQREDHPGAAGRTGRPQRRFSEGLRIDDPGVRPRTRPGALSRTGTSATKWDPAKIGRAPSRAREGRA